MKKALCFLILAALAILLPNSASAEIELVGESAILVDLQTGLVLYEKNAQEKMYPASTTKILTAIIALEQGRLEDEVIASELAARAEGSRVYLVAGEKHTLEELLYALLLNSANDAAIAIAEHLGGSVEGFADMMNRKAVAIGALNSHFTNPNGLPDEEHYTTAYDLALIAAYAMQNPRFREIAGTKSFDWKGLEWKSTLYNHNKLLWNYEGATGIKTGYTTQAQQTIVASASRNGRELIAVVLKSQGKSVWKDATQLLDYGFKFLENNEARENEARTGDAPNTVENSKNIYTQMPRTQLQAQTEKKPERSNVWRYTILPVLGSLVLLALRNRYIKRRKRYLRRMCYNNRILLPNRRRFK